MPSNILSDHTKCLFWFRRDLRLEDNAGLYRALKKYDKVQPIFIFDTNILDNLEDRADARVSFIHQTISELKQQLQGLQSDLKVYYGDPIKIWKELSQHEGLEAVYTNRDYEPYAMKRDDQVAELLATQEIDFQSYKDHLIFHEDEVVKDNGDPYTVFTPYKKKWLAKLQQRIEQDGLSYYMKPYPTLKYKSSLAQSEPSAMISLSEMGFEASHIDMPSKTVAQGIIRNYDQTRNFPAIMGTSRLGIHFRFGTISIREKASKAQELNDTYLSELVWRDFYAMILHHFPQVETEAFRSKYDRIPWRNNEEEYAAWKEGRTGYPLVDAGMRELNQTGYMHNRVRMLVASFLTKHLLIDWRWGEAYFAEKLLDFDLASNNGGWQWAAGCGTDAAPYFRIFSPAAQLEKFDKQREYVRRYVPEYGTDQYPQPIVDHKQARERCLITFKKALA